MKCPECETDMSVKDSRTSTRGFIRRTRVCPGCSHRLMTEEILAKDVDNFYRIKRETTKLIKSLRKSLS